MEYKNMEIATIYEDNHIIVVIKPQNVPCCPDASNDPNLLDGIKDYLRTTSCGSIKKPNIDIPFSRVSENKGSDVFVGLIHRLDRVTGGVMVYAKTSKAAARLSESLQNGTFYKKYLAVVVGEPKNREQTLEHYLLKNEAKNIVSVVPMATKGAKQAILRYKLLNVSKQVSLVEVKLLTGRSHQIRVQLSHIGTPVFGDTKYGGDKLAKGWNLALWANEVCFTHPTSGDTMRFIVNPPEIVPWTQFDFDRKSHKSGGAT